MIWFIPSNLGVKLEFQYIETELQYIWYIKYQNTPHHPL